MLTRIHRLPPFGLTWTWHLTQVLLHSLHTDCQHTHTAIQQSGHMHAAELAFAYTQPVEHCSPGEVASCGVVASSAAGCTSSAACARSGSVVRLVSVAANRECRGIQIWCSTSLCKRAWCRQTCSCSRQPGTCSMACSAAGVDDASLSTGDAILAEAASGCTASLSSGDAVSAAAASSCVWDSRSSRPSVAASASNAADSTACRPELLGDLWAAQLSWCSR